MTAGYPGHGWRTDRQNRVKCPSLLETDIIKKTPEPEFPCVVMEDDTSMDHLCFRN